MVHMISHDNLIIDRGFTSCSPNRDGHLLFSHYKQMTILHLVGGSNPSEKYGSSVGMIIPNIWKNKNHVPNHQPDKQINIFFMIWKNPHDIPHYLP